MKSVQESAEGGFLIRFRSNPVRSTKALLEWNEVGQSCFQDET